ncbi:hypothetical protein [Sphingopyxis sp.]|uniref:hypothetical protein n=1 Tax=Sphingopyxis sp. TaxID=1908224 RepID=UPI0035B1857F
MTTKPARILVVDDDPELRTLLQRFLQEHGFHVRSVAGGKAMDEALLTGPHRVVRWDC